MLNDENIHDLKLRIRTVDQSGYLLFVVRLAYWYVFDIEGIV